MDNQAGRYFSFGHGGLLRRPLKRRLVGAGLPRLPHGHEAAARPARPRRPRPRGRALHVASYGPASRHDVAWWSGLGLRQVDALLERLDLSWRDGPDGRAYADLPGPAAAREVPGVRLLPEFDALLCGYDPRPRGRFVSDADNDVLWHRANGLMLAPVLVDGRIRGHWRSRARAGPARSRSRRFPGARRLRKAEVADAAAALAPSWGSP